MNQKRVSIIGMAKNVLRKHFGMKFHGDTWYDGKNFRVFVRRNLKGVTKTIVIK